MLTTPPPGQRLRALHVFPLFGRELTNGSEYYAYQLSRQLAALGVQVDVLTTRARSFRSSSWLSLRWEGPDLPASEHTDGLAIFRFPVLSMPRPLGRLLSRLVLRRWRSEAAQPPVGQSPAEQHYRRASARPIAYDLMMMAGLGPWSPALLAQLSRAVAGYDVVLVGFMPLALTWQVRRLAERRGTPIVLLPLFHPEDAYHHHRVHYHSFARARAILSQTSYSTALFQQLWPMSRPLEIGAGVDPAELSDAAIDGARFRARHGLGDRPLVLFVGRKAASKRYDMAIEAVRAVPDRRPVLVMIGEDADGRPIDEERVLYLGKLPRAELLDAYDACDLLLHPSEYESFGIVLLEAWMRGKPVIANRACHASAALIADGADGFVCDNAADMAVRIAELLARPDLARALGAAGRRKVLERYTWEAIGRAVYRLYAQIAAESAGHTV